jgi:hypothetical protein
METLQINYSPFVLPEIADEFAASFTTIQFTKQVVAIDRNRSLEDFDFQETFSLVISFLSESPFAQSVLGTLTAEGLKAAFIKAFSRLSNNKPKDTPSSMKVEFSYKDAKGSFEAKGNFTKEKQELIFESLTDIIKSGQLQKDSANSAFHKDPLNFKGVNYNLDKENGLFLPHNFQKDREELDRRIQELGH